jgi:futalosine hydrolase
VLSAGIAGGFADLVAPGGTVIGTASIAADLGPRPPTASSPSTNWASARPLWNVRRRLVGWLRAALPSAVAGGILSVSTVTGTADRSAVLRARYPDAVAEGMEGFGVAVAAAAAGIPFAELRTISNPIGPRDRAAWRIPDALAALAGAGAALADHA